MLVFVGRKPAVSVVKGAALVLLQQHASQRQYTAILHSNSLCQQSASRQLDRMHRLTRSWALGLSARAASHPCRKGACGRWRMQREDSVGAGGWSCGIVTDASSLQVTILERGFLVGVGLWVGLVTRQGDVLRGRCVVGEHTKMLLGSYIGDAKCWESLHHVTHCVKLARVVGDQASHVCHTLLTCVLEVATLLLCLFYDTSVCVSTNPFLAVRACGMPPSQWQVWFL
jgi:hypothetical protein